MTSTLVHLALGALLAAALLEAEFDARSLGVVLAATAFPDLDTFIGIVAIGALIYYDTRHRESPVLSTPRAVRVAWVALAAYAFAGIGPDLFTNGANLLYPLHDQFVSLSGHVWWTDQRGLVQTLWEPASDGRGGTLRGTTQTVHYATAVDPAPGPDPAEAERIVPIFDSGLQFLLLVLGAVVAAERLRRARKA